MVFYNNLSINAIFYNVKISIRLELRKVIDFAPSSVVYSNAACFQAAFSAYFCQWNGLHWTNTEATSVNTAQ